MYEDTVLANGELDPGGLDRDDVFLVATDPNGDGITFEIVTNPISGAISEFDPSDGSFTYTPDAGFTGSDTFTYFASDGDLSSNLATVTITVEADGEGEAEDDLSPELLADLAMADWE